MAEAPNRDGDPIVAFNDVRIRSHAGMDQASAPHVYRLYTASREPCPSAVTLYSTW